MASNLHQSNDKTMEPLFSPEQSMSWYALLLSKGLFVFGVSCLRHGTGSVSVWTPLDSRLAPGTGRFSCLSHKNSGNGRVFFSGLSGSERLAGADDLSDNRPRDPSAAKSDCGQNFSGVPPSVFSDDSRNCLDLLNGCDYGIQGTLAIVPSSFRARICLLGQRYSGDLQQQA